MTQSTLGKVGGKVKNVREVFFYFSRNEATIWLQNGHYISVKITGNIGGTGLEGSGLRYKTGEPNEMEAV